MRIDILQFISAVYGRSWCQFFDVQRSHYFWLFCAFLLL